MSTRLRKAGKQTERTSEGRFATRKWGKAPVRNVCQQGKRRRDFEENWVARDNPAARRVETADGSFPHGTRSPAYLTQVR